MKREFITTYLPNGVRGCGVEPNKMVDGGTYVEDGVEVGFRKYETEGGQLFVIENTRGDDGKSDVFLTRESIS